MPITPPPPDESAPGAAPVVSREKEKLLLPSRSAVPVPGARSVFDRGFFRRLRESEGGCFLLVFIGAGIAIFLFGLLAAPDGPLDYLDFGFDVPSDLLGTKLATQEAVYWQVQAIVPVAGPDLETVFLAPVYRRTQGGRRKGTAAEEAS
jgi:hypothetical protein